MVKICSEYETFEVHHRRYQSEHGLTARISNIMQAYNRYNLHDERYVGKLVSSLVFDEDQ